PWRNANTHLPGSPPKSSAARFRKRAALLLSLLTEARRRDLHVRMLPDFVEAGPDLGGLGFLALGFEARRQSVERPAIVRPAAEILAIHRLRLGMLTIVEQEDAQRVPYRHHPVRRFAVTQFVFLRDRRPQRLDPRLRLPFANEDLALEHVVADREQVVGLVVAEGRVLRRLLGRLTEQLLFLAGLGGLSLGRVGDRPNVLP